MKHNNIYYPSKDKSFNKIPLSNIATGFDYGIGASAVPFDGEHKYIRITDIDENNGLYKKKKVVSPEFGTEEKYRVKENDILVARTGASVGKKYIYNKNDGNVYFAGFLIRLNITSVDSKYVFYSMSTNYYRDFIAVMSQRSGQPGINAKELAKFKVNCPTDLRLTRKYGALLTSIDNLISNKNAMVTKLNELKFELLDAVLYNHGLIKFEDDKLKWQKKKIIDVSICLDHLRTAINSNDRQHIKGEYPYFGANNIQGYLNKYTFDGEIVLLAEDGGNFSDFKSRGIAQFYSGKCCVNNHTHVLIGKDSTKFLYFSLVHKDIRKYVNGSSRAKLNKSDMLKIEIDIPEIKIQNKISDILTSMDKLIEIEEKKLNQLELMKRYYLQQIFE